MESIFGSPWWTKPEWIAVALGVATLAVVFYQVFLMLRQSDLMRKQDEILARRAKLRMFVRIGGNDATGWPFLELRVHNDGNKVAPWYYWTIWIPMIAKGYSLQFGEESNVADQEVIRQEDKKSYRRCLDYVNKPVMPGRSGIVAIVKVSKGMKPFSIGWTLKTEDGVFPDGGEGTLEIDVTALQSKENC